MSSMLEQAIIDASALKEAALKNAEEAIIEKYSHEIKEAVDSLLFEQEEEDPLAGGMEDLEPAAGPALEDEEGTAEDMPEAPLAATGGEDLCPCPDDEEVVDINFDQLAAQVDAEAAAGEAMGPAGQEPREDALPLALEEEIELDDDFIDSLIEELTVDLEPQKSGWLERPLSQIETASDEALAVQNLEEEEADEDDDGKEVSESDKSKNLYESLQKVTKENKSLLTSTKKVKNLHKKVVKENKDLRQLILSLKETLEQTNVSNAKLLYTNKVLNSDSLNERQKHQLAEAISKTDSVEEAKVIYETLQSTVGVSSNREPKSLSEAVNRNPSTTLRRRDETPRSDSTMQRMKRLAGLI